MDIYKIFMDSAALNISSTVYQHKYGVINIDDLVSLGFYAVQFTPMTYTIHYSIEVNVDAITEGKLVCDAKYMSPLQENLCCYLETQFG